MLFTAPGLFTYSTLALEVIPLHVRAGTVVAPEAVSVPPTPTFPRVESVETVRDPVMLLVPTIDNPPEPFEIWPVEFTTCVQDTYPTVEVPVTVSPLVEVRPAEVSVPAMDEFPVMTAPPLETVKPADVLRPAQVSAAFGSIVIPI